VRSFSGYSKDKDVQIRGTILCLDESQIPSTCTGQTDLYGIRSGDQILFFMPEDKKAQIFRDSRVRDREIEVHGWLRDVDKIEIIRVFSVKQGRLFEIQYFCGVCNITAFVGGKCWCCQEEFEFREVPIDK
jgi:hypothetical protein